MAPTDGTLPVLATAITAAVKRPVRQFLTSGDADQKVSDDGTFRTLFLRALRGEETADANRDGYLTGTELSFYLEDRMINLTQGLQTPRGGKLRDPKFDQGDFVFVLAPPGEAEATTTTSQKDHRGEQDTLFWSSIKDSKDPADFEAYLAQFPRGTFASFSHWSPWGRTSSSTKRRTWSRSMSCSSVK